MTAKRCLIICRHPEDLPRLNRIRRREEWTYLVASDDIRVQQACSGYPWVEQVLWMEDMESYFGVTAEVLRILEVINSFLKSLAEQGKGMPAELLFWIQHCEGGLTTQRIQDLLLLIRSYRRLLEASRASDLFLLASPGHRFEEDVLLLTAKSLGVGIELQRGRRPSKSAIQNTLKKIVREPYYNYLVIRAWVKERRFKRGGGRGIVLQLCSSELKHVGHTVPLMRALQAKGENPVALCWRAAQGANLVRQEGLHAVALEAYVSPATLVAASYLSWRTWRRAEARKAELVKDPRLAYLGVPLGGILWPSVEHFFTAELPQRYRLSKAVARYFRRYPPLAIRLWTTVLAEGVIASNALRANDLSPLLFTNTAFAYNCENPYQTSLSDIDLELAHGPRHQEYLLRHGVLPENIVIVGKESNDTINSFRSLHSKEESRQQLGIGEACPLCVVFDSGVNMRGYQSCQEQISLTASLLEFARRHPSVTVIVKPHPSHVPGPIDELIKGYAVPNVMLVDSRKLPLHVLNAADVLITKYSTLGVEAMSLAVPVISVILDKEPRFQIYDDAADYVFTVEQLEGLLQRLACDGEFRARWREGLLERQARYLSLESEPMPTPAAELGAEAIIARVARLTASAN